MNSLQETLESLQPYVIGIRYVNSIPVIDLLLKNDWVVPESNLIITVKDKNPDVNYYMVFSEKKDIGLDQLIMFVRQTINVNIEREKKQELLQKKILELKTIFKENQLLKLETLKFIFSDENEISEIENIDEKITINTITETPQILETILEETKPLNQPEPSDEEKEIIAEELRYQQHNKIKKENSTKTTLGNIANSIKNKIELPPKEILQETQDCTCEENEACKICIDRKSL